MLHLQKTRALIGRLTLTLLLGAHLWGFITLAVAAEPAPAPPPPESHKEERRALRDFDRFLDHHPLLEDQLRRNSQLTASPAFLNKNPELREFLKNNPKTADGLKIYPRYFLNRGLLRQANAPVSFKELAAFKELFRQQPSLELALTDTPELIRDPAFLNAHPELLDFLTAHPVLAQVFLPSTALATHNLYAPI